MGSPLSTAYPGHCGTLVAVLTAVTKCLRRRNLGGGKGLFWLTVREDIAHYSEEGVVVGP